MTESPFIKAEGPEPPDEEVLLGKKHRETMAKLGASILDQLTEQSIMHIPENTPETTDEAWGNMYTADTSNQYAYYREQMKPDREEIEQVRAEVYRTQMEMLHQRNKLMTATDELNRMSNSLRRIETKLFDAYQLIGQLVGYLDSIEWGTHEEWTRSQSLRERAHEYLTVNDTIAT